MWLALFGYYRQTFPEAMAERLFVFLVALPWLLLLEHSCGANSRRWIAARLALIVLLMDRLMAEQVFWLPMAAVVASVWAAASKRERDRRPAAVRRSGVPAWLSWLMMGQGMAVAAAYGRPHELVAYLVLLFILVGFYGFERGTRAAGPANGDRADRSAWVPLAVVYAGAAYVLLMGSVECVGHFNFIQLLVAGMVGWTGLEFAKWRRRGLLGGRPTTGERVLSVAAPTLCGIIVALLLGEVYFRFIYDASDSNANLRTCLRWTRRHVVWNSWGYRDREFPRPDQLGEGPRVLLLGDSFAYGAGIDDDADRLGPTLERELQRRLTPSVRVFTTAVGGFITPRETAIFEKDGRRLKPQVVVLAYHLNDIDGPQARVPHPGTLFSMWCPLTDSSDFLEFFIWRVFERTRFPSTAAGNPSVMDYQDEAAFARQVENVRTLMRLVREAGAVPVVVLYPFLSLPTDAGPQRIALDRIAGVFTAEHVSWLDVSRLVNVNDRRFHANRFDPHPNPALNRAVAAPLADRVVGALQASVTQPAGEPGQKNAKRQGD